MGTVVGFAAGRASKHGGSKPARSRTPVNSDAEMVVNIALVALLTVGLAIEFWRVAIGVGVVLTLAVAAFEWHWRKTQRRAARIARRPANLAAVRRLAAERRERSNA